jgi:DNA-binding response OmpR family regulator
MKILIVEDEMELAKDMADYLNDEHYICEIANSLSSAIDKTAGHFYDCILLDLMLPDGNGLTLLKELNSQNKHTGLIIISAKDALEDKVKGLNLGADDYLSKPFHHSELAARVHSVIRRKQFDNSQIVRQHNLTIDILAKEARIDDKALNLTKKELDLLLLFIGNKNKVLSKSALAEHLSGDFADMFDNHDFVYAHVKNLKKKLKAHGYTGTLYTVYGTGYKWEA